MNTQLLELNSLKIYADLDPAITVESGGDIYMEIKYVDLDGENKSLIYHSTKNGLTGTDEELDNNMSMFMTILYYAFDRCDLRNEFYDAMYKMNFHVYKRGYNKYVLIDRASKLDLQVQTGVDGNGDPIYETETHRNIAINIDLDEFVHHLYMNSMTPNIHMKKKDSADIYRLADDGVSTTAIPFEYSKLIKNYEFRNMKVIWDTAYDFTNNRMLNGSNDSNHMWGMSSRNSSVFLPISGITDDTNLATILTIAIANPTINFHVALLDPYTVFVNSTINDAAITLKSQDNIRLYGQIQVAADWSLDNIDAVTTEINGWYTTFNVDPGGNYLDGILIQGIKYAPDNITDIVNYTKYQEYYSEIKKHCHRENKINDKLYQFRLNVIGKMYNVLGDTEIKQYSRYDSPADMIWSYDSTVPLQLSQVGELTFSHKRIISVLAAGALSKDEIKSLLNTSNTLYLTEGTDYSTISTLLTGSNTDFLDAIRERNYNMPLNDVQENIHIPTKQLNSNEITNQQAELLSRGFTIVDDGSGGLVLTKV